MADWKKVGSCGISEQLVHILKVVGTRFHPRELMFSFLQLTFSIL
jgi:hypothetical protein